jgi:glycosyltransferase involved in cell wall biosynthesis
MANDNPVWKIRRSSVAVIVPTHNRAEMLGQCLSGLFRQRYRPFSIVIVDDGSRDETSRVARAAIPPPGIELLVLRQETAGGPARARNRGWRSSDADAIAFTDDDCVPQPDWLKRLVTCLVSAPGGCVGIGGAVLPSRPGLIADYMTYHSILEPPPGCDYLVTANCIYWRRALVEVGGFDEGVKAAGGEDPGLSFALSRRAYCFAFEPRAVVRHSYRESLRNLAKTFFRYGKGVRHVVG